MIGFNQPQQQATKPRRRWTRYVVLTLLVALGCYVGEYVLQHTRERTILADEFESQGLMKGRQSFALQSATFRQADFLIPYIANREESKTKLVFSGRDRLGLYDRLGQEWAHTLVTRRLAGLQVNTDEDLQKIVENFDTREVRMFYSGLWSPFRLYGCINPDPSVKEGSVSQVWESKSRDNAVLTRWDKPLQITDAGLGHLQAFPQLEVLDLTNIDITDEGIFHLTELAPAGNLKELVLKGTNVTDRSMESICLFPSLEILDLSRTQITNEAIDGLLKLKNLETLSLTDTQVTLGGAQRLRTGLPDCDIRHSQALVLGRDHRLPLKRILLYEQH